MDAEVWRFLLQGGALAVLAALVLLVGPKMLDRRVEALEGLAKRWEAGRERDRAQIVEIIALLERIAKALEH